MSKWEKVRANVPRRRRFYRGFIIAVIVVFVFSIVDIAFLDQVAEYGVYGAYAILFIWAIILLFAPKVLDRWSLKDATLRCPSCTHMFQYSEDHFWEEDHVAHITCPVCAVESKLPAPNDPWFAGQAPKGKANAVAYECGNCEEKFMVGTYEDDPKPIRFSNCPHCGEPGMIGKTQAPDKVNRQRVSASN